MLAKRRNIAIIAHVDHGKTTLVDQLLRQSGTIVERNEQTERLMDSNDLEKERGITILAKTTAINWQDYHINIVDTPGHADFGGEVERILSMVDSVLLLVDAQEGPMPQTRFVTKKAFEQGLCPIVVINKIDKPGARAEWVMDQVFELFDQLGATDEQLDFPVIYTSAINGTSSMDEDQTGKDMQALFEMIRDQVEPPKLDENGPFQMQITTLDYSSYVGTIGIGRITRGKVKTNSPVTIIDPEGKKRPGKILQVFTHLGLERKETDCAYAGDIVCVTGMDILHISDTLCAPDCVEALPALSVDEPTVQMTFCVNDSPFVAQDGKLVTSRVLLARLERELKHNVAMRMDPTEHADRFLVSGRGELHLSILIETMRREGYELAVSRPQVIIKTIDGVKQEPYETLTLDIEQTHQGAIMEHLGAQGGDLQNMSYTADDRMIIEMIIPARSLIGFHGPFLTMTSGSGIMSHVFSHYAPMKNITAAARNQGAMISNMNGKALAFSLFNLQKRGTMLIGPQTAVYEGMIVGLHSKENDLTVNPTKAKQLNNIRAASKDENIVLTTPVILTLEQSLGIIKDDELVEITPNFLRLRKKIRTESDRKSASRVKES